jgi:hypothetical protein
MATIIRQTKIWQELERELPPGLEEVREFLWILSGFDQELVEQLALERGHGRDDHPVGAMWNLIAVGLYLRNGKFSELLGELRRNSDLARLLGFEEILRSMLIERPDPPSAKGAAGRALLTVWIRGHLRKLRFFL